MHAKRRGMLCNGTPLLASPGQIDQLKELITVGLSFQKHTPSTSMISQISAPKHGPTARGEKHRPKLGPSHIHS